MVEISTARVRLRPWRESDAAPFAQLNGDARVMEHFPATLSRAESDAVMERMHVHFETHGYGFWVAELPGIRPFTGFVGLSNPSMTTHFTPCVEIGWRMLPEFWGRGYVTEAARACLDFAFARLHLAQVVSFTVPGNLRSRAVMERLGMQYNSDDDFDHPGIADGHRLRRHVLYRIDNPTA